MGNQSSKHHHQVGTGGKPKKIVHWKSAERPSPPGRPLLIPPSDHEPEVITLKWDRPRSDGGSPIIGYIVEHRRLGSAQWIRATPSLIIQTEVAISGLEPGWRYQFRVIAENVVGKSDPSELSNPLTVTLQKNATIVPRFVKDLADMTIVENDRLEMKVVVVGQPPPKINWFKDGFEIFSSRRTKIVSDNETSVLIIHQCAFTDEGEIRCTATNRAGYSATRAILKVVAPPKIRLPRQYEDGLIVEAGEVLRLKVGLAGQPPPSVVWCHEGEVVCSGNRFELSTTDKNSSLKINNVKRSDRGEYTLRASNYLGEDVASFLVTVTSKPNPPGKVQLIRSFGRSVTITWTAPDDDGGCKIGNYIVEYFRIGWNVWLKASTTRQLSTTLHDLIEGSEYKFRVKAENPYGVSEPSDDSDIHFIPDPRRGITKPVREDKVEAPQIPPKRKTLSPIKRVFGGEKRSSRSPSPNPQEKPNKNIQFIPEMFENEQLHREMRYGTSPDERKETKPTVTFKDDSSSTVKPSEGTNKKSAGTQSSISRKADSLRLENKRFSGNTFKQDIRRKMSLPGELERLPIIEVHDMSESPKLQRHDSLIMEKIHQFFKKSPSPSRKIISPTENKSASLERMPEENTTGSVPTLQRKDSLIIEKVQNFFRRSPSPTRQLLSTNSSSSPAVYENSQKGEPTVEKDVNKGSPNLRDNNSNKENPVVAQNGDQNKITSSGLVTSQHETNLRTNPTIEITAPKKDESKNLPLVQKKNESINPQLVPKKDEAHDSNEFMLVLHPIKKLNNNENQDSFDLELNEALSPPPLSFSVPELTSEQLDLQLPPLRRSVSSTELLYEKAMDRFYEAVEMEEAEKVRKQKLSQDLTGQEIPGVRKRLESIKIEERLSLERRVSLRRRSSEETIELKLRNTKIFEGELSELGRNETNQEKSEITNILDVENDEENSLDYGTDYTESTASSSEDSMAKFKMEMVERTRSKSTELDTYHPRKLSEGNVSPYRSFTPLDQSAIVLNKPMPFPSPDFVPKPILKRSSAESVAKNENPGDSASKLVSEEEKPAVKESGFSFSNIFKSNKTKSEQQHDNSKSPSPNKTNNENEKNTQIKTTEVTAKSLEDLKKQKLERRQSSEEETKVVVDHYSDIMREVSSSRNRGVPLYMRKQEHPLSDHEEEKREEAKERLDPKKLINSSQKVSVAERQQSDQNKNKLSAKESTSKDSNEIKQELTINSQQIRSKSPVTTTKAKTKQAAHLKDRKIKSTPKTVSPVPPVEIETPPIQRRPLLLQTDTTNLTSNTKTDSEKSIDKLEIRSKSKEELLLDEAQESVRSTISHITNIGLLIVACWVYIFKDVRLVIPILALLIYRQIGEALKNKIPDWMKKKKD